MQMTEQLRRLATRLGRVARPGGPVAGDAVLVAATDEEGAPVVVAHRPIAAARAEALRGFEDMVRAAAAREAARADSPACVFCHAEVRPTHAFHVVGVEPRRVAHLQCWGDAMCRHDPVLLGIGEAFVALGGLTFGEFTEMGVCDGDVGEAR